jgi:hypothetical protein
VEYHGVEPKVEAVPPSWAPFINPSPSLLPELNPFCHSHLSGSLTVNGLWCTYLGIILLDFICKMSLCTISWDVLVWPKLVDMHLHSLVYVSLWIPTWASTYHHMKRRKPEEDLCCRCVSLYKILNPVTEGVPDF